MLTTEEKKDVTLPEDYTGEIEMPTLQCPMCVRHNDLRQTDSRYRTRTDYRDPIMTIALSRGERPVLTSYLRLDGIVTCLNDNHRRPVTVINNTIDTTAPDMPISDSKGLIAVPDGVQQDVEEAERAHFSQCFKAAVVMCRRAMQLGLVDKGIPDASLTSMLEQAKKQGILKDDRAYALALGIKDYGDGGAHREDDFTDSEVRAVVFAAVKLLNDIYS